MSGASDVLSAISVRGWKIVAAESCTGGMLMATLTDVPGSSAVVDRGFVTYSNAAKVEMLGVSAKTLEAFGAVSIEVAREMAEGALAHSPADVAISITGVAGPGASEAKPEGLVCFGVALRHGPTRTELREFGALGRATIRREAVKFALGLVYEAATGRG